MDPIFKPLNKEEKERVEKKHLKEWEYMSIAPWTDPDSLACNN
jgi:hypothetical protein